MKCNNYFHRQILSLLCSFNLLLHMFNNKQQSVVFSFQLSQPVCFVPLSSSSSKLTLMTAFVTTKMKKYCNNNNVVAGGTFQKQQQQQQQLQCAELSTDENAKEITEISDKSKNSNNSNSPKLKFPLESLKMYWGKNPLLLTGIFRAEADRMMMRMDNVDDVDNEVNKDDDEKISWPTWEDVLHYSNYEDAESRLVGWVPGDDASWELRFGPFDDDDDYDDNTYYMGGDDEDDDEQMEEEWADDDFDENVSSLGEIGQIFPPPSPSRLQFSSVSNLQVINNNNDENINAHNLYPESDKDKDENKNTKKDSKSWTLILNDVDRHHPPLSKWIDDTFDFIPRWRRDDGQISVSNGDGGGIGMHVDNYHVFLVQMYGTKQWDVGHNMIGVKEERELLIDDLDVRVLNGWGVGTGTGDVGDIGEDDGNGRVSKTDEDRKKENLDIVNNNNSDMDESLFTRRILEPGDVLYLPPRFAHRGTSLEGGCM